MLHTDAFDRFADAKAVTVTAISDVIDLGTGNTTRDIGAGEPVWLVLKIDTSVTSSGDPDVTFKLVSDSTENLATSPTTHITAGVLKKATLVAGYEVFKIALPPGAYERYVGISVTVGAGGPLTAGAYTAYLTHAPHAYTNYADGEV